MEINLDTVNDIANPRILILDCDRFELSTLADSLRLHGLEVVGKASELSSAEENFRTHSPDAIVANFQGCEEGFLDLINRFREKKPSLGIVILTDSPDLRLFGLRESDLPEGAQLLEKSAVSELREIKGAVDHSLTRGAKTGWVANIVDKPLSTLTDIQIETLRLLANGLSNSDIGKARYVSEKSVEQTITRIAQHLNVVHERGRNMRVTLASAYFKWLGAPSQHLN